MLYNNNTGLIGRHSRPRWASSIFSPLRAFTIVEVMLAASVLVLAISSSLTVLMAGMRAIDTARYTTLAGQVLQSQMEKLRLLTWTQLTHPTFGPVAFPTFAPDLSPTSTPQIARFNAAGTSGRCAQSIVSPTTGLATYDNNVRIITLTAAWKGMDGRVHTLSYITHYGKNGISDFFYTSH